MAYLISLVPVVLYLLLIKGLDGFSLARWTKMVECLVWGIVICVICFFLGRAIQSDSEGLFPLIEEVVKCLPLIVAIHRKRSAFFAETLIYGAAIGAGFAILENVLYISLSEEFTMGDAILRGFGTALLHMGCTALLATLVLLFVRSAAETPLSIRIILSIDAIVPSFAIHYLYNLFLLPEFLQMILVVLVIVSAIMLIYSIDEKLIHGWLDLCINNDINLYTSIKEGNLKTTNAGQYLMMAKDRFQPEVFFDILCYLGLYLEISIAAKSRMIMKEAELDVPISEEEHKENVAKFAELKSLRKSIGTAGILFLSPLVNARAADEWAMNELL